MNIIKNKKIQKNFFYNITNICDITIIYVRLRIKAYLLLYIYIRQSVLINIVLSQEFIK